MRGSGKVICNLLLRTVSLPSESHQSSLPVQLTENSSVQTSYIKPALLHDISPFKYLLPSKFNLKLAGLLHSIWLTSSILILRQALHHTRTCFTPSQSSLQTHLSPSYLLNGQLIQPLASSLKARRATCTSNPRSYGPTSWGFSRNSAPK